MALTPQLSRRNILNTKYSPEVGEAICDLIVDGFTPLEICDGEDGRPSHLSTLKKWIKGHADFAKEYEAAWVWRVECMAREIVQIADDDSGDFKMKPAKGDGPEVPTLDRQNVARAKLAIDSRWKMLATEFPARYGWAVRGGASPMQPGDDSRLIDAKVVKDEIMTFSRDALRDEALAWAKK